jgi:ABC-type glycerol-3-phosphate transport system permease component
MKNLNRSRLIKRLNRILIYLLVLLAVILSVAPIIYLLITSFKDPELTFAIPPYGIYPTLLNYDVVLLLWASVGSLRSHFATGVALVLGTLAAYGFSRFRFRGHFWLRISTLIPQMLPPITLVVPFYVLFSGLDWIDTLPALIISYLTFTIPLSIWMMIGFFDDVPVELEEAAMIDGCSRFSALIRISLPLVLPGGRNSHPFSLLNEFMVIHGEMHVLPVIITSFATNRSVH